MIITERAYASSIFSHMDKTMALSYRQVVAKMHNLESIRNKIKELSFLKHNSSDK
jgi:hypothetical protein